MSHFFGNILIIPIKISERTLMMMMMMMSPWVFNY